MRRILLTALLLAPLAAHAQSQGTFTTQITKAQLQAALGLKVDVTGGTLTSPAIATPTITGGTLTGAAITVNNKQIVSSTNAAGTGTVNLLQTDANNNVLVGSNAPLVVFGGPGYGNLNYFVAMPSAVSGAGPTFSAQGSDSNIGAGIITKGAGGVAFSSTTGGQYFNSSPIATGAPQLIATGTTIATGGVFVGNGMRIFGNPLSGKFDFLNASNALVATLDNNGNLAILGSFTQGGTLSP